ncbi:MAG: DegT/DnrJ/EryC1/StrS family aminotransferase [Chitinophagales bacterium]|nr:DegT/DnrJ/EryC1/StrS family aminotransferase [Chitinophagales bacterium]
MINVTKPFLPPIEEYNSLLQGIWKRSWLTNNGPLVNEFELKVKEYCRLDHMLFLNNGTIAIQIAIKALELTGEIITTPFSYVATTSSIVWEGLKPVFVDVDAETYNIDPHKIEEAITPATSAILATHVFGNPCDIEAIQAIADKHNLKVIYDAAHAFGVKYKGKSVFEYGDISTTSFHATKLFHTVEGGAVFTKDAALLKKMTYLRNFGHSGPEHFADLGINGKNSEFHAAMGLVNLKYIDGILASRKRQTDFYKENLAKLRHSTQTITKDTHYNHSYFPVVFETEEHTLKYIKALNAEWVFPRRYFHPVLNKLPYVDRVDMPVAESLSNRIICLPLYHDLAEEEQLFIIRLLMRAQNN